MSASFLDNTLCTEANHLKGMQKGNTFIHFHLILTAHVKFYSFGFFTGPFLSGRLLWVSPDLAGTPVGLPLKSLVRDFYRPNQMPDCKCKSTKGLTNFTIMMISNCGT